MTSSRRSAITGLALSICGCSHSSKTTATSTPTPAPVDYTWTEVGPSGGFFSSVGFQPGSSNIWISGDDGAGLFLSSDGGASLSQLGTVPVNQSSYSLAFDPTDGSTVYAPSHFGWGFLRSTDGGSTWENDTTGLPSSGTAREFNGLAVDPGTPSILYAALTGGLFISTDSGSTFSAISSPAFGTDVDFEAVVARTGMVVAGSGTGRLYSSTDQGTSWTELTTGPFESIAGMAITSNALYASYSAGYLVYTTSFVPSALFIVNDPTVAGDLQGGLWTRVAAASGTSRATDTVYLGSAIGPGITNYGFFASTNGGASFQERPTGIEGVSVFNMAIDPANPLHLVMGSAGGGVFYTEDGGLHWAQTTGQAFANSSLALEEDPSNPLHLLESSTPDVDGAGGVYETTDGGSSWSKVTSLVPSTRALDIDPATAQTLLAGTFGNNSDPAILRSTAGSSGPWTPVLSTTVTIDRFVRQTGNPEIMALAVDFFAPATAADVGIYVSSNGGASWAQRSPVAFGDIAAHPTQVGEWVAGGGQDVYATVDGFQTTPVALGLASLIGSSDTVTSVAFDPDTPTTLLAGTASGRLFATANFASTAQGVTWKEVTPSPVPISVTANDLLIKAGRWYAAEWTGDIFASADSTPGIYRSDDQGTTWTRLDQGLYPCRMVWKLHDSTVTGRVYAGMWDGGVFQLAD